MDIAFCINDGYAPYIGVTIKSLLENNKKQHVNIHILSDDLSSKSVRRLNKIAAPYDVTIYIYIVSTNRLKSLKLDRFTVYAWLRILLPEVLPTDCHRVLYLDSDIVVADDLTQLFDRNMDEVSTAAVLDFPAHYPDTYLHCDLEPNGKYICSGVLLMNLDYWREHNVSERVYQWAKENSDLIVYPDQDAINHICHQTIELLPLRYGIVYPMLLADDYYRMHPEAICDCIHSPAIVHFNGCAPWYYECIHPMVDIWDHYNGMLGRYKAKLQPKKKTSWLNKFKSRIWYATHPISLRHKMPHELLKRQIEKFGLETK